MTTADKHTITLYQVTCYDGVSHPQKINDSSVYTYTFAIKAFLNYVKASELAAFLHIEVSKYKRALQEDNKAAIAAAIHNLQQHSEWLAELLRDDDKEEPIFMVDMVELEL